MTKEQIEALPEPTRTTCIEAHRRYLATAEGKAANWERSVESAKAQLANAENGLASQLALVTEYTELLTHFDGGT